jgi:hypothetical protein
MNNAKSLKPSGGKLVDVSRFNPLILAAVVIALTLIGYFLVKSSRGANTTLYLNPASSTVASLTTFNVAVRLNTADNVSMVRANLSYPASLIDFVSVSGAGSAFAVDGGSGGGTGTIYITRTNSSGVSVTGDQLVATLTFKSKTTAGAATVSFINNSSFVFRSSDYTNVLSGTNGGTYNVTAPVVVQPPVPPPTPTPTPIASPMAKPTPGSSPTPAKPPASSPATTSQNTQTTPSITSTDINTNSIEDSQGITNTVIPKAKKASVRTPIPLSTWLVGGLGLLAGLGGLAAVLEVARDRRKHRRDYAEQLSRAHKPNGNTLAQSGSSDPLPIPVLSGPVGVPHAVTEGRVGAEALKPGGSVADESGRLAPVVASEQIGDGGGISKKEPTMYSPISYANDVEASTTTSAVSVKVNPQPAPLEPNISTEAAKSGVPHSQSSEADTAEPSAWEI